jgi:hypothetical protein
LLGARDDACTANSRCVISIEFGFRSADEWCARHRNVIIQRNGLSVR